MGSATASGSTHEAGLLGVLCQPDPEGHRTLPAVQHDRLHQQRLHGRASAGEQPYGLVDVDESRRGKHSIRTGFEFRVYQEADKFFSNAQTGQFTFDSTWTRGPLDNSATSPSSIGQSVAALLLGLPARRREHRPVGGLHRTVRIVGILRAGRLQDDAAG